MGEPVIPDLKNMTMSRMKGMMQEWGQAGFHGSQVFSWLYRPGVTTFAQMTDLSKDLRVLLSQRTFFSSLTPCTTEISRDGTTKLGFQLHDNSIIESVLIPEEDRVTLCVSSQAGCAMKCAFCRTGSMGFKRNLTPAEIVGQVCAARDYLLPAGGRVTNIVFMGMGEPLANFDHLVTALLILTEQRGLDFSGRRITVSTCGIVPKIRELGEKTAVNLAISLHSPTDELRSRIMPINRTYPLQELLAACREFPLPRRRRIMFEYLLLAGINDSDDHARSLARLLHAIPCKINLLPFNESEKISFYKPTQQRIEAFQQILWQKGFSVFVRESRGGDISAACGQLATKLQE